MIHSAATNRLLTAPAAFLAIAVSALCAQQPPYQPGVPARNAHQPDASPRDALRTEAPARPASRAPSPDQIAAWVGQLDAEEFLARETAMLELLQAGPGVIPVLEPVLNAGSLEATSRAIYILRQLALAADFDTQDQAGALLAELASRKETPAAARRAAAALDNLQEQRRLRALAELEALGAKVTRSQFLGGLPLDEAVLSVEIGAGFQGDEGDLRRLKWLHDVPVLILAGEKVTDGWIKYAAAMPDLQELHLYQAKITDEGLSPLAGCPSLAQVGLYYTPVGDKVLQPLAKLSLLSFVKLFGTKVTAEGVQQFKAASGVTKVDRRRGAFLGIGSLPLDGTCLISTVHEGSPAQKSGLERDDVIIRFGDARVTSFDTLQDLISERDVGEEVEVEVVRRTLDDQGGQGLRKVVAKVTLAPWELELAVRNGPRP